MTSRRTASSALTVVLRTLGALCHPSPGASGSLLNGGNVTQVCSPCKMLSSTYVKVRICELAVSYPRKEGLMRMPYSPDRRYRCAAVSAYLHCTWSALHVQPVLKHISLRFRFGWHASGRHGQDVFCSRLPQDKKGDRIFQIVFGMSPENAHQARVWDGGRPILHLSWCLRCYVLRFSSAIPVRGSFSNILGQHRRPGIRLTLFAADKPQSSRRWRTRVGNNMWSRVCVI